MKRLTFIPSVHRDWSTIRLGSRSAHVTGWAIVGKQSLSSESLARHIIQQAESAQPISQILGGIDGNFAVVFEDQNKVFLGVDIIRSIPLFYRNNGNNLMVSDDIRSLYSGAEVPPIDRNSAVEFATAGYVTGPHTLFGGISALQSGECVYWTPRETTPTAQRYYRYECSYDAESTPEELCETLDTVSLEAFRKIVESLDGRQVIIPLSGGLDSRFVASGFKRIGYDNVTCLSYGVPGNQESIRSKAVANALGYQWVYVPYSSDMWTQVLKSPELKEYWGFSANGVSVPHCDDWPAVRSLREHAAISGDATFVPGHTGDFISGGHLKYLFDPLGNGCPSDFDSAMIQKHYSLWEDLTKSDSIRLAIKVRLRESLNGFPRDSDEDLARMYEYWEWQERQAKLIVNSVRSYEFFGYSWRLPLWEREFIEFWKQIPIVLKMDKFLYRQYLASYDPFELFQDVAPVAFWDRDATSRSRISTTKAKIKSSLRRVRPLKSALERFERHRGYFREYRLHPLGLATAYGALNYVFRAPSKRHSLSLLLKDFLLEEYGLEVTGTWPINGNNV